MNDVFLDSSVLIGLIFRNEGERQACRAALPNDCRLVSSNYVIFEIARGFLRRLITLHNISFEHRTVADILNAAGSGQRRYTYDMPTWIGAVTDYLAELEKEDGQSKEQVSLDEFRAKLRGWIRRGWKHLHNKCQIVDVIRCRKDIPAPFQKTNQRIDQVLPDAECGTPTACGLQAFVHGGNDQVTAILNALTALPKSRRDAETEKRIDGLNHLLSIAIGEPFEGKQCYRCGDALICMEAPDGHSIATKNRKHFEPVTNALAKPLIVTQHARTTSAQTITKS